MSNIPTALDSAIEAAYRESKRAGFAGSKRLWTAIMNDKDEGRPIRESVGVIERAIEADRQYRIADAIMREVKPT